VRKKKTSSQSSPVPKTASVSVKKAIGEELESAIGTMGRRVRDSALANIVRLIVEGIPVKPTGLINSQGRAAAPPRPLTRDEVWAAAFFADEIKDFAELAFYAIFGDAKFRAALNRDRNFGWAKREAERRIQQRTAPFEKVVRENIGLSEKALTRLLVRERILQPLTQEMLEGCGIVKKVKAGDTYYLMPATGEVIKSTSLPAKFTRMRKKTATRER